LIVCVDDIYVSVLFRYKMNKKVKKQCGIPYSELNGCETNTPPMSEYKLL